MRRTVRPIGPINSPPLALVGEAPGREEDLKGKPFVGKAGFMLKQMLASVGIPFDECYVTNVANIRPPNNDFSYFYADKSKKTPTKELVAARKRLWSEIEEVRPKVIVALGEEPMKSLTQQTGISNHRGIMFEREKHLGPVGRAEEYWLRVLPTFHPSYVQRVYLTRPIVELDLRKAWRQAHNPFTPQPELITFPSKETILWWLEQRFSPVSVDLETFGSRPIHTRCIGFAWNGNEAISIPLIKGGQHCWDEEDEYEILLAIRDYLEDSNVEKYLQNAPFDLTVLANEFGINVVNVRLDTMFSHHLLYPELPKSLDFLSSIYTDLPIYWADKEGDQGNAQYNCLDCCVTWTVAQKIEKELKDRGMWNFYNEVIHPAIFALTRMQNRGILINVAERENVRRDTEKLIEDAEKKLEGIAGRELNVNSPKQIKEFVYGDLNLPVQKKIKTRKPTVDDSSMKALARKFPDHAEVLRLIPRIRSLKKLISTYIDAELASGDRMKTSYNLAGQVTGRISSSETIEGYGGNLTAVPKSNFRRLYRADPGKLLIVSDLKQAEYRVFCWLAKVTQHIDLYVKDPFFDVHRLTASEMWSRPESEVTDELRSDAKNGVYAGNYGVGPMTFSRQHDIEFRRAKNILERYRMVRPELERWQRKIDEQIRATRKLRNPLGRERIFFGRLENDTFRAAYSHSCQSTVADVILKAIVELDKEGVEILLQVHDELVVQCPEDQIDQTARMVKKAMEIPIKIEGVEAPLTIPVEIKIGPDWWNLNPYEVKDA